MRLVGLVDSRVTLSVALSSSLRRICPLLLAAEIYLALLFAPTRLNIADDPTRECEVRPPVRPLPQWWSSAAAVLYVASLPPLRAAQAAWVRLVPCILTTEQLEKMSERRADFVPADSRLIPFAFQPRPKNGLWDPLYPERSRVLTVLELGKCWMIRPSPHSHPGHG